MNRLLKRAGLEELEALKPQASAVHGALGVVAVLGDQFGSRSATLAEQASRLGVHVAAVAGDYVSTDKGWAERTKLCAEVGVVLDRAQKVIRIDGLPVAAKRRKRRSG